VYGLPVGLLLSSSPVVILGWCLLAAVTGYFTKSEYLFWQIPVVVVSALSLVVLIVEQIQPSFSVDGWALVVLGCLLWALLCFVFRTNNKPLDVTKIAPLAIFSLMFSWFVIAQPWSPVEGFLKIAQFGEDNGSWLNNIAYSYSSAGSKLTSASGISGGILLAVISALAAVLIRAVQEPGEFFDPAALVLWRLYLLLMLICGASALSIFLKRTNTRKLSINLGLGLVAVVISVSFSSSIMGPGYLTALIAVTWLTSTLFLSVLEDPNRRRNWLALGLASLNLVVVGEVWFPTYLIGCVIAVVFLLESAPRITRLGKDDVQRFWSWLRRRNRNIPMFVAAVLVISYVVFLMFAQFRNSTFYIYVSDFKALQALIGNTPNAGLAHPYFSTAIMAIAALVIFQSEKTKFLQRFVLSCVIVAASVIGLSMMTPPYYEIRYGASKFYVIIAATLAPLALARIAQLLQSRMRQTTYMAIGLSVLTLLFSLQMGSPINSLTMFTKPDTKPWWFDSVVTARKEFPDRIPLCLNTNNGVGRDESSYVCARLSIGIAGGERGPFSGPLYTFQWGNICTIAADTAHRAWTDDFFQNISIVLSNPKRLSAENDCHTFDLTATDISPYGKQDGLDIWPIGWLSTVKWNSIKLFDQLGNQATPSFDYLIDDAQTPDPERARQLTDVLLKTQP